MQVDNKVSKGDIVEQIKNKQQLPNPHHLGEVCRISAHGDPDLKQFSGCWCIVIQVNPHTCGIKTWKTNLDIVNPKNLEITYGICEETAAHNCDRIQNLAKKVELDYEPTHGAVLTVLGKIPNPSSLTAKQERILAFIETEY